MYLRYIGFLLAPLLLICAGLPGRAAARNPSGDSGTEALVARYYQIVNASLHTGDVSALAAVFAPDATLTRSTPLGEAMVWMSVWE
jgi:hypothetical protein